MRLVRTFFAALLLAALPVFIGLPAFAATNVPSVATPGVVLIPIEISGQRTADVAGVARIKLPFAAKLLGVSASARASGGTTPTLTVDVKVGANSLLSAPISVTAGSVAEGTVTTSAIADETVLVVNLAITGTNPTWDDITVLLTVVRV